MRLFKGENDGPPKFNGNSVDELESKVGSRISTTFLESLP